MTLSPWSELDMKRTFAKAILRDPGNGLNIALELVNDMGKAIGIASIWPTDPDVLKFKEELIKELGDAAFLPTKTEIAKKLLAFIDEKTTNGSYMHSSDDRLKAYKLYCEVLGYIDKPAEKKSNGNGKSELPTFLIAQYDTPNAA